jgi:hypothetical protein
VPGDRILEDVSDWPSSSDPDDAPAAADGGQLTDASPHMSVLRRMGLLSG